MEKPIRINPLLNNQRGKDIPDSMKQSLYIWERDDQNEITSDLHGDYKREISLMEEEHSSVKDPGELQPRKVLSRVGWALFLMAFTTFASQLLISNLIYYFYPEIYFANWFGIFLSAISVMGIGYPVFILVVHKIPDSPKGDKRKLSLKQFFAVFFISAAFMYITNFITSFFITFIAMLRHREVINPVEEMIGNSNLFLNLFYVTLVGPIMEEIVFRKYLLNKLRRFGDLPAIIFTGLAFGFFHMNLSQFLYAAALGVVFAYVALRTNTIKYSIILHMMINFIGSVAAPMFAFSEEVNMIGLFFIWVVVSTVIGLVLFNRYKNRISLEASELAQGRKRDYIRYTGTILYLMICAGMMVYILVM